MYARVWRQHDLEGALGNLPHEFEWVVPGFPGNEATRGPEGTLEFFRDWMEQWDEPDTDWMLQETRPDTVLAIVTTRGRGRVSGVPVEMNFAQVWTFRDGEPVRMVLYPEPDKGRRAAGAEPRGAP
ncbi:MAG TPA: nuclear transport factor 2 family protein [Thermoleophilaceae bacterium]|nr:nuclear transport factor 2 family protein [Thermoleophilaceae bacterium]